MRQGHALHTADHRHSLGYVLLQELAARGDVVEKVLNDNAGSLRARALGNTHDHAAVSLKGRTKLAILRL